MTVLETQTIEPATDAAVPVHHYYDPNEFPIAYCGHDLTDEPECPDGCSCFVCPPCDAVRVLMEGGT